MSARSLWRTCELISSSPDGALVEVHVPDGPDSTRVLRVIAIGDGDGAPDEVLGPALPLVTEPPPRAREPLLLGRARERGSADRLSP